MVKREALRRIEKYFLYSSALALLTVGAAKCFSAFGSAPILKLSDPILGFQFQVLLFTVGLIELVVAIFCILCRKTLASIILIAWISSLIVLYRIGLFAIGYHKPCECLGSLTSVLNISPLIADAAMKIILGVLFIGSYGILSIRLWKRKKI